jgi:hypothetical protein
MGLLNNWNWKSYMPVAAFVPLLKWPWNVNATPCAKTAMAVMTKDRSRRSFFIIAEVLD